MYHKALQVSYACCVTLDHIKLVLFDATQIVLTPHHLEVGRTMTYSTLLCQGSAFWGSISCLINSWWYDTKYALQKVVYWVGHGGKAEWDSGTMRHSLGDLVSWLYIFCTFLHWWNVIGVANDNPVLNLSLLAWNFRLWTSVNKVPTMGGKNYHFPQKQIDLTFNTCQKTWSFLPKHIAALWFWESYHFFFSDSLLPLCFIYVALGGGLQRILAWREYCSSLSILCGHRFYALLICFLVFLCHFFTSEGVHVSQSPCEASWH